MSIIAAPSKAATTPMTCGDPHPHVARVNESVVPRTLPDFTEVARLPLPPACLAPIHKRWRAFEGALVSAVLVAVLRVGTRFLPFWIDESCLDFERVSSKRIVIDTLDRLPWWWTIGHRDHASGEE